ncbi:hypothetical protein [Polynucleobacter sp. IMCC 29146]|uniref:hypothetical protein n=1 Tax=Polynucleobacter sp. IMCC 29146 TaxID=2780953 RepID=UPI001F3151F3|nr:hypothetical protein [Polynucleobacter sp. IMCC 29146]MCE7530641.1 hypothetical protein [Polynucleobacter sp. IMCC 29146]
MKNIEDFYWDKKNLLVEGGGGIAGFTHASHPCVLKLGGNQVILIFSMRNSQNHSFIFTCLAEIKNKKITVLEPPKLALEPGMKGTFDSEGLLSCCVVNIAPEESYLYYSGWNNLTDNLWICDTGLAVINHVDHSIRRKFQGPIMARDRHNPYFAAGTSIMRDGSRWRSWYNSGISWSQNSDGSWKPLYGIHYAESKDGIDWNYYPGQIIPFKDQHEHSFGRPTVVNWWGTYLMWFSCRGANNCPLYRIGFAQSNDGLVWTRNDGKSGIEISSNSDKFDSESIAYPYPFEHDGIYYMLYNGNNYGKTGFGYAVLEAR